MGNAEALMVGYTHGPDDPIITLSAAFLQCKETILPIGHPVSCSRSVVENNTGTAITRHSRKFDYIETGIKAPAIVLRHVWLNRSLNVKI